MDPINSFGQDRMISFMEKKSFLSEIQSRAPQGFHKHPLSWKATEENNNSKQTARTKVPQGFKGKLSSRPTIQTALLPTAY